jgi:hypothetical protein
VFPRIVSGVLEMTISFFLNVKTAKRKSRF